MAQASACRPERPRVAVKQALLAGDIVVGAGNIYACEALFLAGIDPRLARASSQPPACRPPGMPPCARVLAQALEAGGSTLRDFKDAHGVAGSFQMQAQVYGREGQPCLVCGTPIRRIVQGAALHLFLSPMSKAMTAQDRSRHSTALPLEFGVRLVAWQKRARPA